VLNVTTIARPLGACQARSCASLHSAGSFAWLAVVAYVSRYLTQ